MKPLTYLPYPTLLLTGQAFVMAHLHISVSHLMISLYLAPISEITRGERFLG